MKKYIKILLPFETVTVECTSADESSVKEKANFSIPLSF